jgi:hypothetical protein
VVDRTGHDAAARVARRRRLARIRRGHRWTYRLDQVLGAGPDPARWRECAGDHHAGLDHDWYGACSGASYTVAEYRKLMRAVAA